MRLAVLLPLLLLILLFLQSCGDRSGSGASWVEPFPNRHRIAVVDSIGIESGDSCYTFAAIAGLEALPEDRIAVLDQVRCCVLVYSADGEFIGQVSRTGEGPGELRMPQYMTLLSDGRLAVMDMVLSRLSLFDAGSFEHLEDLELWRGIVPIEMASVGSGDYAALLIEPEQEEGVLYMRRVVGRFSDGAGPDVRYWEDRVELSLEDPTRIYRDVLFCQHVTADPADGRVFMSSWSTEEWTVTAFDSCGAVLFEMNLPLPRVPKTADELADEKLWIESYIARTDDGLVVDWQPDPYRWMTGDLCADGQGRLWVRRKTEPGAVFDVLDPSGEQIATAEVDYDDTCSWRFFAGGSSRMLAYPEDPHSGYQKVFVLELPELI